jgi:monofunctional biosynthetic peptidoglycan transglycosylase
MAAAGGAKGLMGRLSRARGAIALWAGGTVLAFLVASAAAVLALRFLPPLTSAFMLEARLGAMLHGDFAYANAYRWTGLDSISPHVAIAVIASEDQQFPFHAGFDIKSIREAIRHNAEGRRVRGGSTISQQVAKNLFLWGGRSWVRKGLEAWYTILIELAWPKERILEVYLNVAEFGRGVYGVEAAAQRFFHKSAARLTPRESATLAAVLPSPQRFHAENPSRYVSLRREQILAQMRALGGQAYLRQIEDDEHRLR